MFTPLVSKYGVIVVMQVMIRSCTGTPVGLSAFYCGDNTSSAVEELDISRTLISLISLYHYIISLISLISLISRTLMSVQNWTLPVSCDCYKLYLSVLWFEAWLLSLTKYELNLIKEMSYVVLLIILIKE